MHVQEELALSGEPGLVVRASVFGTQHFVVFDPDRRKTAERFAIRAWTERAVSQGLTFLRTGPGGRSRL
jgi:hypothetical protein